MDADPLAVDGGNEADDSVELVDRAGPGPDWKAGVQHGQDLGQLTEQVGERGLDLTRPQPTFSGRPSG